MSEPRYIRDEREGLARRNREAQEGRRRAYQAQVARAAYAERLTAYLTMPAPLQADMLAHHGGNREALLACLACTRFLAEQADNARARLRPYP